LVEGEEEEFRKFTLGVMRNLGERNYVRYLMDDLD
jgi:hypothetical protein